VAHKAVAAIANATSPAALRAMTMTIGAVAHKAVAAIAASPDALPAMTTIIGTEVGTEARNTTAAASIAAGSEIRAATPRRHDSAGGIGIDS